MPLSTVCEQVMDNCLSEDPRRTTGIGGDNMTCIVVLVSGQPSKRFLREVRLVTGKIDVVVQSWSQMKVYFSVVFSGAVALAE